MRTLLIRTLLGCAALLTSCVQVIMVGAQKEAITRADVEQIKHLIRQEPTLHSAALFIRPLSAQRAAIQSGSAREENDRAEYHTCTVLKRNQRWYIDEQSIQHPVIVVNY